MWYGYGVVDSFFIKIAITFLSFLLLFFGKMIYCPSKYKFTYLVSVCIIKEVYQYKNPAVIYLFKANNGSTRA